MLRRKEKFVLNKLLSAFRDTENAYNTGTNTTKQSRIRKIFAKTSPIFSLVRFFMLVRLLLWLHIGQHRKYNQNDKYYHGNCRTVAVIVRYKCLFIGIGQDCLQIRPGLGTHLLRQQEQDIKLLKGGECCNYDRWCNDWLDHRNRNIPHFL